MSPDLSAEPPGLKSQVAAGFKWYLLGNGVQRLLALAATALLARRLDASVFGTFALAFLLIDGLTIFQNLGLDSALVQRKELPGRVVHTAFVLIAGSSLCLFLVCFAVAPLFGSFYGNPSVVAVVRALGVLLLFGSLSRVPTTLLCRDMRFQRIQVIGSIGAALRSVLSVLFVIARPSVWSLVAAHLCKQLVVTLLNLVASGYRPRLEYDRDAAREILGFGRVMLGVGLLSYCWASVDGVLVGWLLGTVVLGHFSMAVAVGDLVNRYVSGVIADVTFPAFARIQSDRERLRHAFFQTTRVVAVATVPFGLLLLLLAHPLVLTLYGPKWLSTVASIRLLGLTAIAAIPTACAPSLFRACGKPRFELYLKLAAVLARVPLVVFGAVRFGLEGAVLAGLVTALAYGGASVVLARHLIDFRYRDFVAQFSSIGWAALAMCVAMLATAAALGTATAGARFPFEIAPALLLGTVGAATFLITLVARDRALGAELGGLLGWKRRV